MANPYVPIDAAQCQSLKQERAFATATTFMKVGPPRLVQCTRRPVWVAMEIEPSNPEGAEFHAERGAMSLCDECRDHCATEVPTGVVYAKLGSALSEGGGDDR